MALHPPPLLEERTKGQELALLVGAPVGFGVITGAFLGISEPVYLVLSLLGILGGIAAGYEHNGALRGLLPRAARRAPVRYGHPADERDHRSRAEGRAAGAGDLPRGDHDGVRDPARRARRPGAPPIHIARGAAAGKRLISRSA